MTTNELLRHYVTDRSEQAFTELVREHIDLVYSAALRQVNGDPATAQDVTQAVVTDLARKAPRLARHTSLTVDEAVKRVLFAHPSGYAEATPAGLVASPTITLQPWGRLEGKFLSGERPAQNREICFQYGSGDYPTLSSGSDRYRVKTDSEGQFVFPQVPPGLHKLMQVIEESRVPVRIWSTEPLMDVEIRPGETTTVTVGGSDYTVTARLLWPAGLRREPNWRVGGSVHTQFLLPPADIANNPEALASWRTTPEFQSALTKQRHFRLTETPDGALTAERVPPGDYVLDLSVSEPSTNGGPWKLWARANVQVTVPADPPSGTLDLGELALEALQ